MSNVNFSASIRYIGCDDKTIDLFESQYVVPNGVSYNSYVILDDKIAVMDTVDRRFTQEWLDKLEAALDALAAAGETAYQIGSVVAGKAGVELV